MHQLRAVTCKEVEKRRLSIGDGARPESGLYRAGLGAQNGT